MSNNYAKKFLNEAKERKTWEQWAFNDPKGKKIFMDMLLSIMTPRDGEAQRKVELTPFFMYAIERGNSDDDLYEGTFEQFKGIIDDISTASTEA